MHHSALIGEHIKDAPEFGWKVGEKTHDWEALVSNIQGHIASLNWGYRVELREKQVTYHNALAKFIDAHTVEGTFRNQKNNLLLVALSSQLVEDHYILTFLVLNLLFPVTIFSRKTPPREKLSLLVLLILHWSVLVS